MTSAYLPGLIQIRPQYQSGEANELTTPENVLWWQSGNLSAFPLTSIQLGVIATAFDPAWANLWKTVGASVHKYMGCIVTDWSSSTGLQLDNRPGFTPVAGTGSGWCPANVAMLTSLVCGGMPKYRGGHPRVYLPMLGSAALNDTYDFSSTAVTNVTNAWASLDTAMSGVGAGNGGPFQQVAFRHRNVPASAAVYTVTHRTVQTRIATQRRRLRKAPHH